MGTDHVFPTEKRGLSPFSPQARDLYTRLGFLPSMVILLLPRTMPPAALIESLRRFFASRNGEVVCVYLFGSHARGTAVAGSDVDVGVLYTTEPPETLAGMGLDLAADLEAAIGHRVDLVVLNRAPVDLIHRVLRDGVLVCQRDRSARIRFEVRARNEYFDLLPYLRQYRQATGGRLE